MKKRLLYIGNKLSAHGYTATSIETLGSFLEKEGFTMHYASSRKNKILRMLDMIAKTLKFGRSVDYVIIDTYSTVNFWYAVIVSQLCRVLRTPYITALRGGNLPERLVRSPGWCSLVFRNSAYNVAPSGYLLDVFEKASMGRVVYIPNTINLADYAFKLRDRARPRLLWVRSFSPIYNPKMAIDLLEMLESAYDDAELCMVGPDKIGYQKEVADYAESKGIKVRFTGKLSKPQWHDLSAQYDIFINTTHFDNTPVSVMEAMALGLPVVSTNVGGLPYLLEDGRTALLVDDGDAAQMSSKVIELIENPHQCAALSSQAREESRGFDWHEVRFKWLEILK